MTERWYINFEGDFPDIVEVSVLMMRADGSLHLFHRLICPTNISMINNKKGHYSHCIPKWKMEIYGSKEKKVLSLLADHIKNSSRPLSICGYGNSVKDKSMYQLLHGQDVDYTGITFSQIPLLKWKHCVDDPIYKRKQAIRKWFGGEGGPCSSHIMQLWTKSERKRLHGSCCTFLNVCELYMMDKKRLLNLDDILDIFNLLH